MIPRDRVLTALAHEEPDRVPTDFGAASTSSIVLGQPYGYEALCAHLGIEDPPAPVLARLFGDSVANPDERILERFGADLRWIGPGGPDLVDLPDGTMLNPNYGYLIVPIGGINQADDARAPLRGASSVAEVLAHPSWPDVDDPRITAGKREEARRLRERGYAVVANPGVACEIFQPYARLRGWDTWITDMIDDPDLYHALASRILDVDLAIMGRFLPEVAESTDIVFLAEDLGAQMGPLVSLRAYREFIRPYQARWIEEARRLVPGARIMLHTCGDVHELVPDLIDIGVDILQPVQTTATRMEPWRLKRDFGAALSFCGGLDIQKLLPFGSVEDVRRGTLDLIRELAPGGGYIFAPSHEILPDAPPENIAAAYATALEHGRYPIVV